MNKNIIIHIILCILILHNTQCLSLSRQNENHDLTIGTTNQNNLLDFPITVDGQKVNTKLVLDGNWHWLHSPSNPSGSCNGADCAIQGIPKNQWVQNYGIHGNGNSITLDYVTKNPYGVNVGSRVYLTDPSGNKYYGINMLGKQISFQADMSKLGCGLNGALYFVQMPLNGGNNLQSGSSASMGLGYCDAQCPSDIKFVNGKAGQQGQGVCCAQFDIWQANNKATQMTSHVCKKPKLYVCKNDAECGRSNRYGGICDMDGADINPYRLGNKNLYGTGSQFKIDTNKPFTVKTQFITDNGKQTGNLKQVKRIYVQNGKTVTSTSLTDSIVAANKKKFNQNNYQQTLGGLKAMGAAFKRKMVLVLSIWDDSSPTHMKWLDAGDRGPCSADSGNPDKMRKQVPNSKVTYSNFKITKLTNAKNHFEAEQAQDSE